MTDDGWWTIEAVRAPNYSPSGSKEQQDKKLPGFIRLPFLATATINREHPARIRVRIDIRICWLRVRLGGQVFVRGRICALVEAWYKHSPDGRMPSQKYGASIRPWMNTPSIHGKNRSMGRHSPVDE